MAATRQKWNRVSRKSPCPVCSKFKGCLVSANQDAAICIRITSDLLSPSLLPLTEGRFRGTGRTRFSDDSHRLPSVSLSPRGADSDLSHSLAFDSLSPREVDDMLWSACNP